MTHAPDCRPLAAKCDRTLDSVYKALKQPRSNGRKTEKRLQLTHWSPSVQQMIDPPKEPAPSLCSTIAPQP
ncbi:hypothetical protein XM38_018440 [Halomicronema hongdechloris C2206]|uniref:Uncharacterized protein n=1 Tax=Halomicronema hongdechloris C2206 TaxID=1641165 RepID=A0A1Z3HKW0_9CYAN|nr:hypothetical protein XM38_018440 [Halomicronema hongdechloris C2206]